MTAHRIYDDIDQVQHGVLSELLIDGSPAQPRQMNTLELVGHSFVLLNPRKRCLASLARGWSLPAALGELCWHASGSDELSFLSYYFPRWLQMSDSAEAVRGSCYGKRVFGPLADGTSQWVKLLALLKADPASRRAVLTLSDPNLLLNPGLLDSPCATSLQFLVRNGSVEAVATMRSNDAIWGLPYDVFLFTSLQELVAESLSLSVGTYTHFSGSMHVYETHFDLAKRIVADAPVRSLELPPFKEPGQLRWLLEVERALRLGEPLGPSEGIGQQWKDLRDILLWFRMKRSGDLAGADALVAHNPYRLILPSQRRAALARTE